VKFELNLLYTLLVAIVVLFAGRVLVARVGWLGRFSVPAPVVGGVVIAIVLATADGFAGTRVSFDMSLKDPLLLAFFTSVGLAADARMLVKGGPKLFIFLLVCTVYIVVQNAIGLVAARAMDLHPVVGLLGGSITLTGGHGTGGAYATRFGETMNLQGAMELTMACATAGLVLGGLLGGTALSLFLVMALMAMKLLDLVNLAGPLLLILALQTVAMAAYAVFVTFRVMGRNYDAAIMAAGHVGFGMSSTAAALAIMKAVTGRAGPSPLAFLIVPMVGAFFIDITNALIIQGYLTLPLFGF
jgi:ESS family glutamate:Na+ symporter